jgi:hypothetical protein
MLGLQTAIRAGVVACVGVLCFLGAGRLDDAVAIFDFRADLNAQTTFRDRTYPESAWVAGSAQVMEDARLWMPEDAKYRVVRGPDFSLLQSSGYGQFFLLGLLLPRTQIESDSAPWLFCYGCTASSVGRRYEVLSDSGNGFLFARRRA